jgi:hypothetical protein
LLSCQSGFSGRHRIFGTKGHTIVDKRHFTEKEKTSKKSGKSAVKEDGEELNSRKKRESQLEKLAINQKFRDRDSEEKFESQLEKLAINQKFRDRDSEKEGKNWERALRRLTLFYGMRGRLVR